MRTLRCFAFVCAALCAAVVVPNTCTASPVASGYQYRLAGSSIRGRGRLELRPDNSSQWGTVCNQWWHPQDAVVACRSLGFGTSRPYYRWVTEAEAGVPGSPIRFSGVGCSSTEVSLDRCGRDAYVNTQCTHFMDVWLHCTDADQPEWRVTGGPTAHEGVLQYRPQPDAPWGTLCDHYWHPADTNVACRSIGQQSSGSSSRRVTEAEAPPTGSPVYFSDLGCSGTETDLMACSYTPFVGDYCTPLRSVYITCSSTALATAAPVIASSSVSCVRDPCSLSSCGTTAAVTVTPLSTTSVPALASNASLSTASTPVTAATAVAPTLTPPVVPLATPSTLFTTTSTPSTFAPETTAAPITCTIRMYGNFSASTQTLLNSAFAVDIAAYIAFELNNARFTTDFVSVTRVQRIPGVNSVLMATFQLRDVTAVAPSATAVENIMIEATDTEGARNPWLRHVVHSLTPSSARWPVAVSVFEVVVNGRLAGRSLTQTPIVLEFDGDVPSDHDPELRLALIQDVATYVVQVPQHAWSIAANDVRRPRNNRLRVTLYAVVETDAQQSSLSSQLLDPSTLSDTSWLIATRAVFDGLSLVLELLDVSVNGIASSASAAAMAASVLFGVATFFMAI